MRTLSRLCCGAAAVILAFGGLGLIVTSGRSTAPPVSSNSTAPVLGIVAEPRVVSLSGTDSANSKVASYTLRNTGLRDVEVVGVTTSCGCSLAEPLAERVIRPGESRSLRVRGSPPQFGTAEVAVKVSLQAGDERGSIQVDLHLHGKPLAAERFTTIPTDLELLASRSGTVDRSFEILTVEENSNAPWLADLACEDMAIRARITDIETSKHPDGRFIRRYQCQVTGRIPEEVDVWQSTVIRPSFARDRAESPVTIRVAMKRLKRWTAYPEILVIDPNSATEHNIVLTFTAIDEPDMTPPLEVTSNSKAIRAELLPGETAQERRLKVSVDQSLLESSSTGVVELILREPISQEIVTIPVVFDKSSTTK